MGITTPAGRSWRGLFRGAVRDSLAAANSVARIGTQDTHAWEAPIRYVVDDNHGNVGVVEFRTDGAIAAVSARAPERLLDRAGVIEFAPLSARDDLQRLCELPLLQDGQGVSAIFWTVGESIQGPENWRDLCLHGAELFRREFLPDAVWKGDGALHYGLSPDIAQLAIMLAARAKVSVPLLNLSEHELRLLVPRRSKYESDALELLTSDGLFELHLSD